MSLREGLSFFSQYFLNSLLSPIANSVFRFQRRQRWGNCERNQTVSMSVQRGALFGAQAWCRGRGWGKNRCVCELWYHTRKHTYTHRHMPGGGSATAHSADSVDCWSLWSQHGGFWVWFLLSLQFITGFLNVPHWAPLFPVKAGRWQS